MLAVPAKYDFKATKSLLLNFSYVLLIAGIQYVLLKMYLFTVCVRLAKELVFKIFLILYCIFLVLHNAEMLLPSFIQLLSTGLPDPACKYTTCIFD